jgi:uncharacterized protein with HEPN domain
MNEKKIIEKLFIECERHKTMIEWAMNSIKANKIYPFTAEILKNLDEEFISLLDTLTFRFSKLQDVMGKIFWNLLFLIGEDTENLTFLDVLNKMEKYKIINNAYEWREFRNIRNLITHNYETDYELLSENLNQFLDKVQILLNYYENVKNFYKTKFGG